MTWAGGICVEWVTMDRLTTSRLIKNEPYGIGRLLLRGGKTQMPDLVWAGNLARFLE